MRTLGKMRKLLARMIRRRDVVEEILADISHLCDSSHRDMLQEPVQEALKELAIAERSPQTGDGSDT